jgi:hypothetical protein
MPHALRVRGRAAWVMGKRKKAIDCFQRSVKVAENIGARYDVARSCIDLSRIDTDGHKEFDRRGRDLLARLDAVLPIGEDA